MASKNVVLVHGGFVDGSGWQGVYDILSRMATHVSVVQNPTVSLEDDVAVTNASSTRRTSRSARRPLLRRGGDHRSRHRSQRREARLHRGLRTGRWRVGEHADFRPAARRTRAADPAAAGRLPLPRPGEVPRFIRCRRERRRRSVHGRLSGPVGRRRARPADQRARVAEQAELVLGHNRRQESSLARPAASAVPSSPSYCGGDRTFEL